MPKVRFTEEERRRDAIIKFLSGMAAGKQKELSECWEISQQAVSYRIRHGNITLLDLYKAREIMRIDLRTLNYLIGG